MDDPALVRHFERGGNLARDRQRLLRRQRTPRDPLGERRTFDELEDQRVNAARFLQPMNRRDVWMIEGRENPCLLFEARFRLGIEQQFRQQYLERDRSAEPRIGRAVHLSHAAGADERLNAVLTERRPRGQLR